MYRILVVEDDVGIQAALVVALEDAFVVDTASTVSEALRCLHAASPDLVLLDVCLPDLDGACFLRTLRVRLPSCPVIVVTAYEQREVLRELTALGIENFFRKPFDVDELIAHINALLKDQGPVLPLTPRFSSYVNRGIEYLSHNYSKPLTLETVAGAIGISPSHLAHLFPIETGMTLRRYLVKIRIEVAKRLLRDTNNTLENLADLTGFCDASHLSRTFRQYTGSSPGRYRRTGRGQLAKLESVSDSDSEIDREPISPGENL